jgi:glycosyltransferase involved in cell wall biosynthesis
MRVSMVMASEHNGGLEKHVRELSQELVKQGHDVTVIAPTVFLETLHHTVNQLPINIKRSRYNPWLLWTLYQQLTIAKGDIVHAQANKAAYMVGVISRLLNTPMVATLHNLKHNLGVFDAFKHIICVRAQIGEGFSADKQLSVIYNGIHPPTYQQIDLKKMFGLPKAKPVICAVGRLVPAKGFDVLLEAVNGLPISLIIAGEGPDYARLKQQAEQLDAVTCCKLLGHRDDVHDLVHSAQALVISSRREGFPYAFIEAVMCQAKILSTDVTVSEVLPAELIVNVDDAKALREKLVYLLAHPEEWDGLMQPVRDLMRDEMCCTAMTKSTVAKYEAVLVKK